MTTIETIRVRGEEKEMTVVDNQNNFFGGLFRGANAGIEEMIAGSFYTTDVELAASYAIMEDEPVVYCFNYRNLNLIDIEDTFENEEDNGILSITDEELEMYDGYIARGGVQVCLFGSFNVETGKFTKNSIEECRKAANNSIRRYDR